jgi:hypothetical protein
VWDTRAGGDDEMSERSLAWCGPGADGP